jgi:hypothetical protein
MVSTDRCTKSRSHQDLIPRPPQPTDSTKVINIIIKVHTGLQGMILAGHTFAIQEEDAKCCMQNTLHVRSNDDPHHTHTQLIKV